MLYITELFNIKVIYITSELFKNDKAIFINIPTINKNESIIKEILERFGYYWSNSYKLKGKAQGINWVVMVFYPLYLDNINDKVKKYKYIYHITEEKM